MFDISELDLFDGSWLTIGRYPVDFSGQAQREGT